MPRKISRSAESGRFVSRAEAKRNPAVTVEEAADGYISPAMEAAGAAVFDAWLNSGVQGYATDLARDIYTAMRRAR